MDIIYRVFSFTSPALKVLSRELVPPNKEKWLVDWAFTVYLWLPHTSVKLGIWKKVTIKGTKSSGGRTLDRECVVYSALGTWTKSRHISDYVEIPLFLTPQHLLTGKSRWCKTFVYHWSSKEEIWRSAAEMSVKKTLMILPLQHWNHALIAWGKASNLSAN